MTIFNTPDCSNIVQLRSITHRTISRHNPAYCSVLTVGAARPLRPLGVWRLVLGDLLPDLGEVEDPLPGAARVDGVGEQRLVVVRADEAGVAVLLQQQHVHVLGGLIVGVPGQNSISWTVRSRVLQEYCNVRQ